MLKQVIQILSEQQLPLFPKEKRKRKYPIQNVDFTSVIRRYPESSLVSSIRIEGDDFFGVKNEVEQYLFTQETRWSFDTGKRSGTGIICPHCSQERFPGIIRYSWPNLQGAERQLLNLVKPVAKKYSDHLTSSMATIMKGKSPRLAKTSMTSFLQAILNKILSPKFKQEFTKRINKEIPGAFRELLTSSKYKNVTHWNDLPDTIILNLKRLAPYLRRTPSSFLVTRFIKSLPQS